MNLPTTPSKSLIPQPDGKGIPGVGVGAGAGVGSEGLYVVSKESKFSGGVYGRPEALVNSRLSQAGRRGPCHGASTAGSPLPSEPDDNP